MNEVDRFIETWEREAAKTVKLLAALPHDQYDFRPDAEGRSLGELAWHLAECDAYSPYAIEIGEFSRERRPPGIERPRNVEELAPAFDRLHREAVQRVRKLKAEDLDRSLTFFSGQTFTVRDLLWNMVLLHGIHHRGQLALMCRLAGGRPPALFGPTREERPLPRPKVTASA
ncbi:MAG TPA: DinB family protein [Thermoanaerobaculia bacterium]|jgi:uncharacterized damage-inducible protein DinB|nr:DinB family protein [Thermoanaerobaculia bacterium]